MPNNKNEKNASKYICEKCNFISSKYSNYNKHLLTSKHNRLTNPNEKEPLQSNKYTCHCGKEYKHMSTLCNHKKNCKALDLTNTNNERCINPIENPSLVVELLKQNQEFKDLILEERREFQKIIIEMAGNMGNNNNNTINSNNKFNLNVFLNEKCKDAMSLTDFIKSMEITMEDFIQTGELGFVDGLSRVMIERINNMDLYNRPIHCTDLKRETVYIKDAEKWEKDSDKERLRKAVKGVAYKNDSMRPIWYEKTPEVDILGSENCEKFFKYSQAALGGYGKEETKSFEDKIMKNILKEVTIDKENH
jgi:hypothetical protein